MRQAAKDGKIPSQFAISNGHVAVVLLLAQYGAGFEGVPAARRLAVVADLEMTLEVLRVGGSHYSLWFAIVQEDGAADPALPDVTVRAVEEKLSRCKKTDTHTQARRDREEEVGRLLSQLADAEARVDAHTAPCVRSAVAVAKGEARYALLTAHSSFDVWSLGCILYQMCNVDVLPLLQGNQDDNLTDDVSKEDNLFALAEWGDGLKERKLARVVDAP